MTVEHVSSVRPVAELARIFSNGQIYRMQMPRSVRAATKSTGHIFRRQPPLTITVSRKLAAPSNLKPIPTKPAPQHIFSNDSENSHDDHEAIVNSMSSMSMEPYVYMSARNDPDEPQYATLLHDEHSPMQSPTSEFIGMHTAPISLELEELRQLNNLPQRHNSRVKRIVQQLEDFRRQRMERELNCTQSYNSLSHENNTSIRSFGEQDHDSIRFDSSNQHYLGNVGVGSRVTNNDDDTYWSPPSPRIEIHKYGVVKHGRMGRAKRTLVTLSPLMGTIAWGMKGKRIRIEDIKQVRAGKQTRVFARRESRNVSESVCLSIITAERTLDLELKTLEERDTFVKTLMTDSVKYLADHHVHASWTRAHRP